MFEAKAMAAFIASRKDYDMTNEHVDVDAMSPNGKALFQVIDSYYTRDSDASCVDLDVLRVSLDRKFKDIPRHQERMRNFLEEVLAVDTSAINVVSELIEHKKAVVGTNLADALLSQDNQRIEMYMQEYEDLMDSSIIELNVEEEYNGATLDDLEALFNETGTWKLAPAELGRRIKGNLRPGHAVIVGARPERGKTLFGTFFNAGFLEQGARTLYIGNEDPIPDLVLRLLSCLSGMTEEQMFADKDKAMKRAVKAGYENCTLVGLAPGTLYELEALVRRYEPDVLIMDQMRNVRANTENNTQRLEVVAQEIRNIGRRHGCVTISLTQVGDSGRDKLVLNDGDIDGSNTGIPGACDVIILIGSNEDFERRNLRHLTLAKNKRGGDHGSFTVAIDPHLSRVWSHA